MRIKRIQKIVHQQIVSFLCFCPILGMFCACEARLIDLFICSEDNLSCASCVSLCAMQKLQVRPAVWCLSSGKEIWTAPARKFDCSKVLPL